MPHCRTDASSGCDRKTEDDFANCGIRSGLQLRCDSESIVSRAKSLILDAVGIALASTQYDFSHRTLSGIRSLGAVAIAR